MSALAVVEALDIEDRSGTGRLVTTLPLVQSDVVPVMACVPVEVLSELGELILKAKGLWVGHTARWTRPGNDDDRNERP